MDLSKALQPTWGTGEIAPSNVPDVVGAFRFICGAGHLAYDDPIVYPGQPGKSHLHQFYGNVAANANSTHDSLLSGAADSTCNNAGAGLTTNRSAYWMPAVLIDNMVWQPDYVQVYYKSIPLGSGMCGKYPERCVAIPDGLKFIFGYDMVNNKAATYPGHFQCEGAGSITKPTNTIPEQVGLCKPGAKFQVVIDTPKCWDGKNLDTPDHRSHLNENMVWDADGVTRVCPQSHPYLIPQFTLGAHYTYNGQDLSRVRLASDDMHPELPHGATFHADYFEAWIPEVKKMWQDNCINKMLNCSGGDLGNGKQQVGASQPKYGWANPNPMVPIPPMPGM